MLISGIQPFTLLDYPDHISCVVFTPGCQFRCGYCHNPEFVLPENIIRIKDSFIPEETFFRFLEKRRGLLDGVVVTGGEPTIAHDLLPFIKRIRTMGYEVKLDTNGNRPDVLQAIIKEKIVDYIAMDVKTSLSEYQKLVGKTASPTRIKESIERIIHSEIRYEFRSTLIKEIHTMHVINDMLSLLEGAQTLYLQRFRPEHTLDQAFETYHGFNAEELGAIKQIFIQRIPQVHIRA